MTTWRKADLFYRAAARLTSMYPEGRFAVMAPDVLWYPRMAYWSAGDRLTFR